MTFGTGQFLISAAIPAVNFQDYLPPGHSSINKKTEKEETPFSAKKSGPGQ